jgi:septal ring factor EnvC (AmiA/AmiB activator)
MKKATFKLTSIALFIAAVSFTSCQSPTQKTDAADAKVQDAKQDLKEARQDAVAAHTAATAEEWQAFKTDVESKMKANETRIAELKAEMKKTGKKMDAAYSKSIDDLEQKNKAMKERLDTFGNNAQSDWASFKREFSHDMDDLGNALKNLTVDNKK